MLHSRRGHSTVFTVSCHSVSKTLNLLSFLSVSELQIPAQLFTIMGWLGNLSKQRKKKLTLVSGQNNLLMINKIDNFQFPLHSRLRPPVVNSLQIFNGSHSLMFLRYVITPHLDFNPRSTIFCIGFLL
jgi:hypothetical protein